MDGGGDATMMGESFKKNVRKSKVLGKVSSASALVAEEGRAGGKGGRREGHSRGQHFQSTTKDVASF
jgi:hypothetical protein